MRLRERDVTINRANGSVRSVFECCQVELNFGWSWANGAGSPPQKPSIGPHTWKKILFSRGRASSSLPVYSLVVIPRGVFPRRTSIFWVSSPASWSIAIPPPSESARLSPGLSRLGQYRKRLTCTLTRIHVGPRVRHLSINTLRCCDDRGTDLSCDTDRLIDIETKFVISAIRSTPAV